jgi:hypothetical protein
MARSARMISWSETSDLFVFGIDEQWIDRPSLQVIDQPKAKSFAAANTYAVNAKLPDHATPSRNRTSRFGALLQGFKGWCDILRCVRITFGEFIERCQKGRRVIDEIGWHICPQGSGGFCLINELLNRRTHLGACRDFQVLDLVLKGFKNGLNGLASADEFTDAFALPWVLDLQKAI